MTELPLYSLILYFSFLCSTLLFLNVLFICRDFLGGYRSFYIQDIIILLRGIVSPPVISSDRSLDPSISRSFDPAVPDAIKALLATTLVSDQLALQPPL